jgi:hypothetical protein
VGREDDVAPVLVVPEAVEEEVRHRRPWSQVGPQSTERQGRGTGLGDGY